MKLRALVPLFDGLKLVQPGEHFDGTEPTPGISEKATKKVTEEVPDDDQTA
jgi:hypothetical protein